MKVAPELDSIVLFILFVFPGLISMHIYRLLLPAKDIDWKTVVVQASFYSSLNFALSLPILVLIHRANFPTTHPITYVVLLMAVLLVFPVLLPIIWSMLLNWNWLMNKLQHPFQTAWDYFFNLRKSVFVLIHLKDGTMVGGYYGPNSYATSFPNEGDIFLEAVFQVDDKGEFGDKIEETGGILIKKSDYTFIEFFNVPANTNTEVQK